MRLLILTQYFPPEMGAPQARLHELAVRLVRKGHEVTVLTAMPNYPTGRVFKGYRWKLRCRETIDGVDVIRTALFPSKSQSAAFRMLSYLSFAVSCFFLGPWRLKRPDLVFIESPPLFLVPVGLCYGWLFGARKMMMVSDIWPDIIVRMGYRTSGVYLKAMQKLEAFCYKRSDYVALTNPGAESQINERFPGVKTTVISNGVDRELFRPEFGSSAAFKRELGLPEATFLAGYCGLHGMAQGLDAVIGAAELLKDYRGIHFVLVGDGPVKSSLVKRAARGKLKNVTFLDPKPKAEIPALLASCDASLVPLSTRLPGTMPSKVYEAFAAGVAVIVAKGCEGEDLVERTGAGLTFEPMDEKDLAEQVKRLAENADFAGEVRKNALKVAERFDRDVIARRTEEILQAVVDGREPPPVEW